MLAKYYRLRGVNNTGQTMTYDSGARIAIRLSPWKISSGALAFTTTITEDLGFSATETIVDGGEVEGSVNNNTSNLDFGVKGYAEITHDLATADGSFDIYLEESDDNVNWPSDQASFDVTKHMRLVAVLSVVNDAVDEDSGVNFEF